MQYHLPKSIFIIFSMIGIGINCNQPIEVSKKQPQKKIKDPAPPVVMDSVQAPIPDLLPNPEVLFHQAPQALSSKAVIQDWTSFLGPTHNAVSLESPLLKKWPQGKPQIVWEMKKGTGYTSPAIQGDRLIFFHRIGREEVVECLHPENGQRYWQYRYETRYQDRYGFNNGPRSSPVIDGSRVYAYGAEGKIHCLNLQTGQLIWKRNLASEFKAPQDFFGVATTPLIEKNIMIINLGAPNGASVIALNKLTGELVWGQGNDWGASYASPVVADIHGQRRLFVFAGGESRPPTGGLLSIDLMNGVLNSQFPWRSKSYESVNASNPVVVGNQVFISASYDTGGVLLDVLSDGKLQPAWKTNQLGTHWNTSIHKEGYLYGFDGRHPQTAALVCLDLKTGKQIWRKAPTWEETIVSNGKEIKRKAAVQRGSLLLVDEQFLCLGEMGHLLWLDLSPSGYKEISRTSLFLAGESWTLPVISHGLLYVMQNTEDYLAKTTPRLLCYDLREGE